MKTKGKKYFILALLLSAVLLPRCLMAKEKKHVEFGIGALLVTGYGRLGILAPTMSMGFMANGYGLEVMAVFLEPTLISGNLVLGDSDVSPISLIGTGGVAMSTSGELFFNFGVGIEIKPMKRIAIRAEYRFWKGFGTILGSAYLYLHKK